MDYTEAISQLEQLQHRQRINWSIAEAISLGKDVSELKALLEEHEIDVYASMDRSGKRLMVVAAMCDRPDVVHWLLHEHHLSIRCVNSAGDNLLSFCRSAGATMSLERVADVVVRILVRDFCSRNFHCRRIIASARARRCRRVQAAVRVQSAYQRHRIYTRYRPELQQTVSDRQLFAWKWSKLQSHLENLHRGDFRRPI